MRNFVIATVMLAVTAVYVWMHPPLNLAAGRNVLRTIPQRFDRWNGTELSFEDAVVEELQSDDLLIRRYERDRDLVWLCIVYHQNRRYGAHDPRVCYESQGYIVEHESSARVDDGSRDGQLVDRFVADRPHQRRLVYYWWLTQGFATSDRGAFRDRMALLGALDNRSWGAFVRVETPIQPGHDADAERRLQDFASEVARDLPGRLDAVRPAVMIER
jgi:EpsI family protein